MKQYVHEFGFSFGSKLHSHGTVCKQPQVSRSSASKHTACLIPPSLIPILFTPFNACLIYCSHFHCVPQVNTACSTAFILRMKKSLPRGLKYCTIVHDNEKFSFTVNNIYKKMTMVTLDMFCKNFSLLIRLSQIVHCICKCVQYI